MTKNEFITYISEKYNVVADYPFDDINTPVFRHQDNKKWFAIIMTVKKSKLGVGSEECVNIVNLKCAQEIIDSMLTEDGIFPAYHMSKKHWISVMLNDTANSDTLRWLTSISYDLTSKNHNSK